MFKNKTQDIVGLFKSTGHLIGKDQDLLWPIFYIGFYRCLSVIIFATSGYGFFMNKGEMAFGGLCALILWTPLSAFLQIRHRAALSWMSFGVLKDKDTDLDSGMSRLSGLNGKLFLIAILNMVISNARVDSKKEGFRTYITALFLSIFQGVWEVVKNFLLPSLAIDKGTLSESVARLKHMKKNVPAAISGFIASDVVGSIAGSVLSLLILPAMALGYGIGKAFKGYLPEAWIIEGFNILPMVVLVLLASVIASFLVGAVDGLKSIYYSVFYTSLVHPMEVKAELQNDVTHYLNFNRSKEYDFFAAYRPKQSSKELEIHASGLDQVKVDKVKKAFAINLPKGHSEEKIEGFLISKQFTPELISAGREEFYGDSLKKILPFISEKKGMGYSHQQLEKFLKEKGYPSPVVDRALKAS